MLSLRSFRNVPALLVSVRNAREAQAAVAGGCDILDIKEPDRGPLGMAHPDAMGTVARYAANCRHAERPLPCSAALGELAEWESRGTQFALPPGIDYVKCGSAGISSPTRWLAAWQAAQQLVTTSAADRLGWVAVAYADWQQADGLAPSRVLEAASSGRCHALLIDTFNKNSGNLLDLMSQPELRQLCDSAHESGLTFALAGGLRLGQISELIEVSADVLGVRGAACEGGCRTSPVSATAVRTLKRELLVSFAANRDPVSTD
jgi:uncharacterized protein (UPF0264 family)